MWTYYKFFSKPQAHAISCWPKCCKSQINSVLNLGDNVKSIMNEICGASNTEVIGNVAEGETKFFLCLRHYSVLIFNFSSLECGYKIKL